MHPQPTYELSDLHAFQRQGVDFLLQHPPELTGPHRALLDEQGLGKTPQACAAIRHAAIKTAVILCPLAAKRQWRDHLISWQVCSEDEICVVENQMDLSQQQANYWVVHYEQLLNENIFKSLMSRWYGVVICDEAQRLKSVTSRRSQLVLGKKGPLIARGQYKWLLSGTIMPNRPIELYAALKTLAPALIRPYDSWEAYGYYFCNGFKEDFGADNFRGASHVEELRARIEPFILRRTIDQVYQQLPPVIETVLPLFIDVGDADESNTPIPTLRKMVGDAKAPLVKEFIEDRLDDNKTEKIVVFAYTRTVVEYLRSELSRFHSVHVCGGLTGSVRDSSLDKFKNDPECRVIILQINSAGEAVDGLQLVSSTIVFAEEEWVPGTMDQAISRLRRMKQKYPVQVIRFPAEGYIDNRMQSSRASKRRAIDIILTPTQQENEMSIEDSLASAKDSLAGIAASLKKIAEGGFAPVAPPEIENPRTPPDKPLTVVGGKPNSKSKPAIGLAEPTNGGTNGHAPTIQELGKIGLDVCNRLIAQFKETNSPDPQAAARGLIGAAIHQHGGVQLLKEVPSGKAIAVRDALLALQPPTTSGDDIDQLGF